MDYEKLPILRYLQEPAQTLNELYQRFPDGGEYSWYAFVIDEGTFANWEMSTKTWEIISSKYFEKIQPNELSDGDSYVWDSQKKIFTVVSLNLWATEQF
jgi:hypothetical protein